MVGRAIYNPQYFSNVPHARINYFEIAQSRQGTGGGYAWPNYVDANGYPIANLPNSLLLQVTTEDLLRNYTGNWVIKWDGFLPSFSLSPGTANFSVSYGNSAPNDVVLSVSSTTLILGGTDGRVVWKCGILFNAMPITFNAGALGWNGTLNNLVMMKEADEAAWDAGQKWRQEYLDYIAYINPHGMRFLDWQPICSEFVDKWSQRCRESEFTFASDRAPSTSWVGTLSGNQTYSAAASADTPGSWTDFECFYGYVASANTGNDPTINIGGRGAKTIKTYAQAQFTTGMLTAGFYSFMYVAVHDTVIAYGSLPHQGVPPEVCIDLCNKTNTNIYINIPPFANDDYVTQLITLIRTTLNSGLKCTVELGNEFWNIFSFTAGHVYGKKGVALSLNADQNYAMLGMIGLRTRQVMEIVTTAWSPRSMSELNRTTGIQLQGSTVNAQTYQFNGQNLGSYGYNSAPNRPIDWCDSVAGAPYIEAAQFKQYDAQYASPLVSAEALAAADDYDSADPARMEAALAWLDNDARRGIYDGSRWYTTMDDIFEDYLPAWNTMMGTYGKQFIGYEGGLGMMPPSTSKCTAMGISTAYSAKIAALISAYKKGRYGRKLIFDYLHQWESFANFGVPAMFTNIGVDAWSMREDFYETEHGLEDGFRLFNNQAILYTLTTS